MAKYAAATSSEERKLPIVRMGLFMDDEGIPIAIETFPGNTLDHLTLRKYIILMRIIR